MKLNEGRLLGSKATVGVEAGELKLNPPGDADVDDCNITTNNINLLERNIKMQNLIKILYLKNINIFKYILNIYVNKNFYIHHSSKVKTS